MVIVQNNPSYVDKTTLTTVTKVFKTMKTVTKVVKTMIIMNLKTMMIMNLIIVTSNTRLGSCGEIYQNKTRHGGKTALIV